MSHASVDIVDINTQSIADDISNAPAEYDTPWKIALEQHFEAFMAFYFPLAHQQIDWNVPHEFLDKELQAITHEALVGTRHVDKLVRVQLLAGEEDWICIHFEIQTARQPKFAERMYIYHYRIFDLYGKSLASMALLGDEAPNWLPNQFSYDCLGCRLHFEFPVVKLLQFAEQEAALEANPNPFALLTLAYLQTKATSADMRTRFELKCKMIRLLHAKQWNEAMIRQLFRVVDWMMALPPQLEQKLTQFVSELEEQKKMEYVTSIERVRLGMARDEGIQIGMQEGLNKGMHEGLQDGKATSLKHLLSRRFGTLPEVLAQRIKQASLEQIDLWFDRGIDAANLDEVFQDTAQ